MRLALAQINTVVGDLDGNRERILAAARRRRAAPAPTSSSSPSSPSPATRPRICCSGPGFVRAARESLERDRRARRAASSRARRLPALRPRPLQRLRRLRRRRGQGASTASASCRTTASSTRTATSRPARDLLLLELGETLVGPTICEDMWQPGPPATDLALAGAQLLANISASPFHVGKRPRARGDVRHARARQRRASSPSATPSAARTS